MSNDKKHGLGRGISSLLGGDFSFDESVENIISKNSTPVPVEMPATSVTKKADNTYVILMIKGVDMVVQRQEMFAV